MQISHAVKITKEGISKPFQVHPEVAEWGSNILRRDLKLQRKTGITYFLRRLYTDLHEEENIRHVALEMGQEAPEQIAGVIVIRIATDTNTRLPLNEEQFQKELAKGEKPLLPRRSSTGFGGQF